MPWQQRVAKAVFGRWATLFWPLVGFSVFGGQWMLVVWQRSEAHGMRAFALGCAVIALAGSLPAYDCACLRRLQEALMPLVGMAQGEIGARYRRAVTAAFSFRRNLIAFAIVGVPVTYVLVRATRFFQHTSAWFGNPWSDVYALCAFCLFCFVICHYVAFLVAVVALMRKVSRWPIAVPVHADPTGGLRIIGKAMLVFANQVFAIIALGYVMVWVSPLPITLMTVTAMAFGALIVLAFFFGPQMGIHRLMVAAKHERLEQLLPRLEQAIDRLMRDPSEENAVTLARLDVAHERLREMQEWPFDLRGAIQITLTGGFPVILTLLDKFWR